MKYLAVDYGEKRVGVAISDAAGRIAFPKTILPNDSKLLSELVAFITKENVGEIVVGESRDKHGVENAIMRKARCFAGELEQETGLSVHFEPEAYTSVEARKMTGATGPVDAAAAAIILGSFLDKKNIYDDFA